MADVPMLENPEDQKHEGDTVIKLSAVAGTHYLRSANNRGGWPDEIGGLKFSHEEKVAILDDLRFMGKTLRAYSPIAQKLIGRKMFFGPVANYKLDAQGGVIDFIDPELKIEVRLPESSVRGIYYGSILMASPGTGVTESPLFIDEIVIPVIKEIGLWKQFQKDTGISQKTGKRLLRDGAKEWTEAEEKKGKEKAAAGSK